MTRPGESVKAQRWERVKVRRWERAKVQTWKGENVGTWSAASGSVGGFPGAEIEGVFGGLFLQFPT
jgi:hypothetical protein